MCMSRINPVFFADATEKLIAEHEGSMKIKNFSNEISDVRKEIFHLEEEIDQLRETLVHMQQQLYMPIK